MINELMLLSGVDIPFYGAGVTVHNPSIKEISYIGEEQFFTGCELINISKNIFSDEDNVDLENINDFDIFMQVMVQPEKTLQKARNSVYSILALLFPDYMIEFSLAKQSLVLTNPKDESEYHINKKNFSEFREIIQSIFCLKMSNKNEYNPSGDLSARIAKKLQERHQKLAQQSTGSNKVAIFSRYLSILSVGLQKSINELSQYTVYQLFEEFERYQLKLSYDIYIQAKMAGAKDLEEVDHWMKDLHP